MISCHPLGVKAGSLAISISKQTTPTNNISQYQSHVSATDLWHAGGMMITNLILKTGVNNLLLDPKYSLYHNNY